MKKILGLDLGTTSIGWAFIHEAEKSNEVSKIIKTGARVVPLSSDEQQDFEKGNPITLNADRTLKRSARRNIQRYKLRRENLLKILKKIGFINDETILTEEGENSTHQLYQSRAKAVTEKVSKEDFAKVLLAINKKRGYKSSRKASSSDAGAIIDGMAIAKIIANQQITPGQYSFSLLKNGKKRFPDFYKSDLEKEFEVIWNYQEKHHTELSDHHYNALKSKNRNETKQYFEKTISVELAELKGKDKKTQLYGYRAKATLEKLTLSELALILTDLNGQINQSSNYLANISDRSKELYFDNLTVGQYQYNQLKRNPNTLLKNQVFYRQDYIDEFEKIWNTQAQFYPELNENIKTEIRDQIIFYQRRLKSQKGLVSICELEGRNKKISKNKKETTKFIGPKVAPKSSPVFQIAKTWQSINNLTLIHKSTNEKLALDDTLRYQLFEKLQMVGNLKANEVLRFLKEHTDVDPKLWNCNLDKIEGNHTNSILINAYIDLLINENIPDLPKNASYKETLEYLKLHFQTLGINTEILFLDFSLTENDFVQQPAYEIWHLLYSFEGDNSITGLESLITKLSANFGFPKDLAKQLANITFKSDYGNLSLKALRKILPHLEDGFLYSEACNQAGYNHSKSFTKEENEKRILKDSITILPKNALRNPVVEKILNQMIHVVNQIIAHPEMGRPDEIRIEMARELKKNAKKRKELTTSINKATDQNKKDRKYLQEEIGLKHVSRKDLIKYKLYKELKPLGYKTPYSGTYIEVKDLFFSNKFDVEHIIPQSVVFDDSISNKTLELRKVNLEKGNQTAIDYCIEKGVEADFRQRVLELKKGNTIGYTKFKKLLQPKSEIEEGFINRDLNNTAYIAKKAAEILQEVSRHVISTNGKITDRLRKDWGLIDVLKELNWEKYQALGLTYSITNKEGKELKHIKDWTKRNDHRHHAMDAIAIAFTKRQFIQYLNNLNAKSHDSELGKEIRSIEKKYLYRDKYKNLKFKSPFPDIRRATLEHLSSVLISFKSKNKVVTRNTNTTKIKGGTLKKVQLTPRGQLHKETIYGKSIEQKVTFEKVDKNMSFEKINTVTNLHFREALKKRLIAFDNDPKKAFTGKNSLRKNPIVLESELGQIPEKIKCVQKISRFTIRKHISSALKIDKVIDKGIQDILQKRLDEFDGDPKKAFINLDTNPIWFDKEKTKAIKKVKIEGVTNAIALHDAKDHLGNIITKNNVPTPVDFVSTGNNHHVAIYQDEHGELHEEVVSFFEAVERKRNNISIVNKYPRKDWNFLFSMKQNEMFLFPSDEFDPNQYDLLSLNNHPLTSKHLFRVQKLSTKNYVFNHHLETNAKGAEDFKNKKTLSETTYKFYQSPKYLKDCLKVRLNHLGDIIHIGEY